MECYFGWVILVSLHHSVSAITFNFAACFLKHQTHYHTHGCIQTQIFRLQLKNSIKPNCKNTVRVVQPQRPRQGSPFIWHRIILMQQHEKKSATWPEERRLFQHAHWTVHALALRCSYTRRPLTYSNKPPCSSTDF